jgi:cytochrome c2
MPHSFLTLLPALALAFTLSMTPANAADVAPAADAALPTNISDGNIDNGKSIYRQCRSCHMPAQNSVGPKHCDLVGRVAGSLPDYNYSPAMKKSGITWTLAMLDRFIDHPSAVVPGNYMPFAGIHDPQDRADLIAYLSTLACS